MNSSKSWHQVARFVVRAGTVADTDQVTEVAAHLNTVNLPADRGVIRELLACSEQSFSGQLPREEREFFFVLEDRQSARVIGTSMIHAQHGTRRSPHVYFQLLSDERYSETLDYYVVHECLRICYDYNGPTEIGGLILLPEYRRRPERLGTLLSYLRFVFIKSRRDEFRDCVLSELLPPLEPDGTSRLWEHLGRRFTGLTYQKADQLSKNNKEFIRALFPHGLIYTSLFPDHVRDVIGQVGPTTRGVEKILTRIGFRYARQIDPFDGGPHYVATTDNISVVRECQQTEVQVATPAKPTVEPRWGIVLGGQGLATRAIPTLVPSDVGPPHASLPKAAADALEVKENDPVWTVRA